MSKLVLRSVFKSVFIVLSMLFIFMIGITLVVADPGQESTLELVSGTLNGESVSPSDRSITVSSGEPISGEVTVSWSSAWNPNYGAPIGYTPSWGNHESSFFWDGSDAQSTGTKTFSIDIDAPTSVGTYNIIFAYRAEIDGADVFSMTNWANNPEVWNDGNDIASLSQDKINTANNQGNVQANVLFNDGMQSLYIPITAIEIIVEEEDDTEPPPDNDTECAHSVNEISVTCDGGDITTDDNLGTCRRIICEGSGSTMKVFACDKPDDGNPQYFEMYKQEQNGDAIQKVCLGSTCITNGQYDGYERSEDYCVCDSEPPSDVKAQMIINESFSKDHNYVFHCKVDGFEPTQYEWYFNDGSEISQETRNATREYISVSSANPPHERGSFTRNNIFHIFPGSGIYDISCAAYDDSGESASAQRTVVVDTPMDSATLRNPTDAIMTFEHIENLTYTFTCNEVGFEATSYEFNAFSMGGGDYREETRSSNNTVTFTFPEDGQYRIDCTAGTNNHRWDYDFYRNVVDIDCRPLHMDCINGGGFVDIDATNNNQTDTSVEIRVKKWYPQGRDYVFICEESGYEADSYFWNFGDGHTQTTTVNNVYHTYNNNGDYEVMCEARNGSTESDTLPISVN